MGLAHLRQQLTCKRARHHTADKFSLRGERLAERAKACAARDGGRALLNSFRGPAVVLRSPLGRGRAFYLFAYRAPNIGQQGMQRPAVEVGAFYVGRQIVDNGCPISLGKGKTVARPDAYFTLRPGVGRPQADREDWVQVPAFSSFFLTGLYEVATRSGQSL